MGYTVCKDATEATKLDVKNPVYPVKVAISVPTPSTNNIGSAYGVNDLTFAFTETGSDFVEKNPAVPTENFYVYSIEKADTDNGLYANNTVTIGIAPAADLPSQGGIKTYYGLLHIYSNSAISTTSGITAQVQFTVTSNISLTASFEGTDITETSTDADFKDVTSIIKDTEITSGVKKYYNNADLNQWKNNIDSFLYEKNASDDYSLTNDDVWDSGTTYYAKKGTLDIADPIALGSKEIGTSFDDIVFTAKGGAAGFAIEKYTTNDILDGIVGTSGTDKDGNLTYTLKGAIVQKAYNAGDGTFAVRAYDSKGNEVIRYYDLTATAADGDALEVYAGSKKMKFGDSTPQEYGWTAEKGATAEESAETLTIVNNSAVDLTVKLTVDSVVKFAVKADKKADGNGTTDEVIATEKVWTISKKTGDTPGELVLTITPTSSATSGDNVIITMDSPTATSLASTLYAATAIKMTMTNALDDFVITSPELDVDDGTDIEKAWVVTSGTVGVPYDGFDFDVAASKDVTEIEWSVVDSTAAMTNTFSKSGTSNETQKLALDSLIGTISNSSTTAYTVVTKKQLKETYGLELSSDGKLTGTPIKSTAEYTTSVADGSLKMNNGDVIYALVRASYRLGGSSYSVFRLIRILITLPAIEDALVVSLPDGTNLSSMTTPKFTVTPIATDAGEGAKATVNVYNNLATDIINSTTNAGVVSYQNTGVKASITEVRYTKKANGTASTNPAADIKGYGLFSLAFDKNATINTNTATYGMAIESKKTGSFDLVSIVPVSDNAEASNGKLTAGTYEVDVTFANANLHTGNLTVTATLVVKATPVIDASAVEDSAGGVPAGFTVGSDAKTATITMASLGTGTQFKFRWEALEGTLPEGLDLNENGVVSGEPTTAGTYKIRVYAVDKDVASVSTYKDIKLTVIGSITPTITMKSTNVKNKTFVLPGIVEGKTTSIQLNIQNNSADQDTAGLNIEIVEAEDDRDGTQANAKKDILAHPTNPYAGQEQYFTVSGIPSTIKAGENENVVIATKAGIPAGTYRVKVKVSGTNVTTTYSYLFLIVEKPLTLDNVEVADGAAKVGEKFYQPIIAGGVDGTKHTVTWTEVANAKGDALSAKNPSVITKIGGIGLGSDAAGNTSRVYLNNGSAVTLVYLKDDNGKDTKEIDVDKTNWQEGVPENKGTYTIYLKADTADEDMDAVNTLIERIGFESSAGAYTAMSTYVGEFAKVYPAQKVIATATLTVGNSSAVSFGADVVKDLKADSLSKNHSVKDNGWTAPYSSATKAKSELVAATDAQIVDAEAWAKYDATEGIQGIKSGEEQFESVSGYKFKSLPAGYANGEPGYVHVPIMNTAQMTIDASITIDSSDFTLTDNAGNDLGPDDDGEKTILSLAFGTTTELRITPKNGLAKGEHTGRVSVTAPGVDPIYFDVEFDVVEATYTASLDFIADNNSTAAAGYADEENLVSIGATGETPKTITLSTREIGSSVATGAVKDFLYITNTGNRPIYNVTISQLKDDKSKVIDSTSEKKVEFFVGAATTATTISTKVADSIANGTEQYAYVRIAPDDKSVVDRSGKVETTIRISYADKAVDGNISNIDVPVVYTLYSTNLDNVDITTPTADVELTGFVEGTAKENLPSTTFTVKNTASTGEEKTLVGVVAAIDAGYEDSDAFEVVYGDTSAAAVTLDDIGPDGTTDFVVRAVEGLPYGTYTAKVIVSGGNLKTNVSKSHKVTVTVTESNTFSVDVYATVDNSKNPALVTVDKSFAQRLYNSFIQTKTDTPAIKLINSIGAANGSGYRDVFLDLDENNAVDVVARFTGTKSGSDLINIDGVQFTRTLTFAGTESKLAIPSKTIPFATSGYGANVKHFDSATFNIYSMITLAAKNGAEYINITKDDLVDGKIVKEAAAVWNDDKNGLTGKSTTNEALYLFVQNGTLASGLFGGSLPTATLSGRSFSNWQDGTTRDAVTQDSLVTTETNYVIQWHTHTYEDGFTETETVKNPKVVWEWTYDSATGKYSYPKVTLTCKVAHSGTEGQVVLTTAADSPSVIHVDVTPEDPTCVKGARTTYLATVSYNGQVYKSERSVDKGTAGALGHTYVPTVTGWAKDATSGNYIPSITLVCSVCDPLTEGHNPTVSDIVVTPTVVKEATCTEFGETVYNVTSFKADGKTYTPSDFAASYADLFKYEDKAVAKLEHEFVKEFTLSEDKTKAVGTIVCKVGGEYVVGSADTPAEVPVTLGKDEAGLDAYVGTVVGSDGETYTVYAYDRIYYFTGAEELEWKWNNGAPTVDVKMNYADKDGHTDPTETLTLTATTTDGDDVAIKTYKATTTPKFVKEGQTEKTPVEFTHKYDKDGNSEIWFNPSVEWTTPTWPSKWTKGAALPTVTYKVSYSKKEIGGTEVTTDTTAELTATVTSDPATIATDAKEATFTATANLSSFFADEAGTTPVKDATVSRKYIFKDGGAEGVAGKYTYKSHSFTWGALATKDAVAPTVTAKVVYTLTLEDGTKSIEEVTATPSVKEETTTAKDRRTFTATISTMDEKIPSVFETKTYSIKGETPATGGLEGLVVEGLEDEYYYTGAAIKPAFRLVDYDIEDGVVLGLGTDYTVSYKNPAAKDINNAKDATGTIIINGKGNYDGKKLQVPFKIVNALKSSDDVTNVATSVKKIAMSENKFTFTGAPQAPATLTITTDAGDLTYTYDATTNEYTNTTTSDSPKDVIVTVSNNINAGKGFVAAVGTDGKIKKAQFTIAKFNLKNATADQIAVVVNGGDDVPFSAFAKGAQPLVEATFTATATSTPVDMVAGNDFTVNYKNNKAAGTGSVTLKGKNNFSGVTTTATSFNIEKFDLSQVNEDDVVVNAYATLAAKKVAVTFTDSYGNIVPAKAYTVSVTGAAGAKLAAGEKITISVTAKDASYENSFEISDFEVLTGINKAKLTVDKDYAKANIVYTGSPIILTEMLNDAGENPFETGKIVVKIKNQTLKYGEDYEVVSYANNIKKGKMTVNLKGIGSYTGYAKGTVTIAAKPITKINAE